RGTASAGQRPASPWSDSSAYPAGEHQRGDGQQQRGEGEGDAEPQARLARWRRSGRRPHGRGSTGQHPFLAAGARGEVRRPVGGHASDGGAGEGGGAGRRQATAPIDERAAAFGALKGHGFESDTGPATDGRRPAAIVSARRRSASPSFGRGTAIPSRASAAKSDSGGSTRRCSARPCPSTKYGQPGR